MSEIGITCTGYPKRAMFFPAKSRSQGIMNADDIPILFLFLALEITGYNMPNEDYIKNDKNTVIYELKEIMRNFVEERKWTEYHKPKELAIALIIESAELLEKFLFIDPTQRGDITEEIYRKLEEEAADVLAYLLSFCNSLDIDLTSAYLRKMEMNRKKYPLTEFSDGSYIKK